MQATARVWLNGIARHMEDLRTDSYEGAVGPEREAPYRTAFDLLSTVATGVLADVNELLLGGAGDISIQPPSPDSHGGLIGSWMLGGPAPPEARSRLTGKPPSPAPTTACWPGA